MKVTEYAKQLDKYCSTYITLLVLQTRKSIYVKIIFR